MPRWRSNRSLGSGTKASDEDQTVCVDSVICFIRPPGDEDQRDAIMKVLLEGCPSSVKRGRKVYTFHETARGLLKGSHVFAGGGVQVPAFIRNLIADVQPVDRTVKVVFEMSQEDLDDAVAVDRFHRIITRIQNTAIRFAVGAVVTNAARGWSLPFTTSFGDEALVTQDRLAAVEAAVQERFRYVSAVLLLEENCSAVVTRSGKSSFNVRQELLRFMGDLVQPVQIPELFMIGRPGAGKSTMINTILNYNRARVAGATAGGESVTTARHTYALPEDVRINFPKLQHYSTVDLPGVENQHPDREQIVVDSIRTAIRARKEFKVVFVVEMNSGRRDELARIRELVLRIMKQLVDVAPQGVSFGAILNKYPIADKQVESDLVESICEAAAYELCARSVLVVPRDHQAYLDQNDGQLGNKTRMRLLRFIEDLPSARFDPSRIAELKQIQAMTEGCQVIYFFAKLCAPSSPVNKETRHLLSQPNIKLDEVVEKLEAIPSSVAGQIDDFESHLNLLRSIQQRIHEAEKRYKVKIGPATLSYIRNVEDSKPKPMYAIAVVPAYKRITLVFRGTDNWNDWAQNVKLWQLHKDGGRVHAGFYKYLDKVYDDVMVRVQTACFEHPDYELFVTGHSLGGALATLFAYRFTADPRNSVHCVTIGAPHVGDKNFGKVFSARRNILGYTRVTNPRDPVPILLDLVDMAVRAGLTVGLTRNARRDLEALVHILMPCFSDGQFLRALDVHNVNRTYFHFGEEVQFPVLGDNLLVAAHYTSFYLQLVREEIQRMEF